MSQNLMELKFTSDSLARIDAAIATLHDELAQLRGLDPDQRRTLM